MNTYTNTHTLSQYYVSSNTPIGLILLATREAGNARYLNRSLIDIIEKISNENFGVSNETMQLFAVGSRWKPLHLFPCHRRWFGRSQVRDSFRCWFSWRWLRPSWTQWTFENMLGDGCEVIHIGSTLGRDFFINDNPCSTSRYCFLDLDFFAWAISAVGALRSCLLLHIQVYQCVGISIVLMTIFTMKHLLRPQCRQQVGRLTSTW